MKQKVNTFLYIGYLIVVVGLFLYSYTQVDLNLTLSEWSIWQVIQKFFQHIGYFQRPLSTALYIVIILLLYLFYFLLLRSARIGGIREIRGIWGLIIATTVILTFSYNAFSYDFFNYMFDAKIVTYYHQNPYVHKPLDYTGDPMLSFMHWTHRTYPYGPVWLILTVPLSLGINFFLPTFFLFKALASVSFLGTVFFIGKTLKKINPQNETFGLVFFALNPLVLIESVISAHNDITMMFFAIASIYLLLNKKYIRSLILLALSIGVKFASLLLLPALAYIYFIGKRNKKVDWNRFFYLLIFLMLIAVIFATIRTNFQPWYLLYIMPLITLVAEKYFVFIPSMVISFFALLHYVPFLYLGNWNEPVPAILSSVELSSIVASVLLTLVWKMIKYKA